MPINPSPVTTATTSPIIATLRANTVMQAFKRFMSEAKKRGIRVVMDLVMNHTSTQHPWFVTGKRGPEAPTHSYYLFRDAPLDWGQPWNASAKTWHQIGPRYFYGLFWGGMPDLNYGDPNAARNVECERMVASAGGRWASTGCSPLPGRKRERASGRPTGNTCILASTRRLSDAVGEDRVLIGEV